MIASLRPAALLATLALAPGLTCWAQTANTSNQRPAAAATRSADPADPAASVPRAVHRSALAGYRRDGEPAPLAWREANDNVGRIGGWRAYAREATAAAAAAAPAASAAPSAGGPKR